MKISAYISGSHGEVMMGRAAGVGTWLVVSALSCAASAATDVRVAERDLVPYVISGNAVAASLTGKPGDPARGAKVVVDRGLGNCMSCHAVGLPKEPFPGNLGPDLAGVASRLTAGELRLRLIDPKRLNDATSMPAFYKVDGLERVAAAFAGKPILTAEQIEDVVAYLETLKQ